jgi:hypothetical protein
MQQLEEIIEADLDDLDQEIETSIMLFHLVVSTKVTRYGYNGICGREFLPIIITHFALFSVCFTA